MYNITIEVIEVEEKRYKAAEKIGKMVESRNRKKKGRSADQITNICRIRSEETEEVATNYRVTKYIAIYR